MSLVYYYSIHTINYYIDSTVISQCEWFLVPKFFWWGWRLQLMSVCHCLRSGPNILPSLWNTLDNREESWHRLANWDILKSTSQIGQRLTVMPNNSRDYEEVCCEQQNHCCAVIIIGRLSKLWTSTSQDICYSMVSQATPFEIEVWPRPMLVHAY